MSEQGQDVARLSEVATNAARLLRLLTVISKEAPLGELIGNVLNALSEVFDADVTCVARVEQDRLRITDACGLAEDDPGLGLVDQVWVDQVRVDQVRVDQVRVDQVLVSQGLDWPIGEQFGAVLRNGLVRATASPQDLQLPPAMAGFGIRSAAWVPVTFGQGVREVIGLFRLSGEPFSAADLDVLESVAYRLSVSVDARGHGLAIERLARAGQRLSRHQDLAPLLEEAAELLQDLTRARGVGLVLIEGETAELGSQRGMTATEIDSWPRPLAGLTGWQTAGPGRPWQQGDGDREVAIYLPVMRQDSLSALLVLHQKGESAQARNAAEVGMIFASHFGAALANSTLHQALGRSDASLRLITDSVSDLTAVLDEQGRLVYASPSHQRGLGHDPRQLVGRKVTDVIHPLDRVRVLGALAEASSTPTVEYRMRTAGQGWTWVETVVRRAPPPDTGYVLSSRIVEDRKYLEDELRRRATHDPLTGLANRLLATSRLEHALTANGRGQVGLLFCDLDKFKAVNDRLGHDAGDDLLRQVSARLSESLRPGDLLARFGGDEFVVVLDGMQELRDVYEIGHRLLAVLDEPFELAGELVMMTASVGGVIAARGGTATAGDMLRDADAAMYDAKERGRARVEVFDSAASMRSLDRLSLRSDLERALAANELSLQYQPIVDLASGRISGFEALLRWRHPLRGFVPPDLFIPVAEENGSIVEIGRWVLRRACEQLAAWQRLPNGAGLTVSVNLSPVQLRDPGLAVDVLDAVRDAGLAPADLWLEITERGDVATDDHGTLAALRAAGIHFALDDFGMSHSNLAYLKRFPLEGLKIDKSFVSGVVVERPGEIMDLATGADRVIIRAVLSIAQWTGLTVVAEGIETEDQLAELIALGCRRGQGYLLSRPQTVIQATALVLNAARLVPETMQQISLSPN